MSWRIGDQVAGYQLLDELGRGGMGVVYRALDVESGLVVALKSLELSASPQARARFAREGQAQARVDRHPHVVRVHSAGEAAGRAYLVLDLVKGGDLRRRLRREPLPPADALRVVLEVGRGLAHAHAHGVLHRDLKPANVLFDEYGRAKLVDFGLARLEGEGTLTKTGDTLGTPAYMAPEQVDSVDVGPACDVYGLGALLYACLTGRPPFRGHNLGQLLNQVLHEPAPAPSALAADLPPEIDRIVARALAKQPSERYPSVEAMLSELEACGTGAARPRSRRWLGPALLVVGLVGAGASWRFAQTAQPTPTPSERTTPTPGASAPASFEGWKLTVGQALELAFEWREVSDGGFALDVKGTLSGVVTAEEPEGWRVEAEFVLEHFGTRHGSLVTRLPPEVLELARGQRFSFLLTPRGEVRELRGLAEIGTRLAAKVPHFDLLGPRAKERARDVARAVYDDERLAMTLTGALGLFVADSPWEFDGVGYRTATATRVRAALPNVSVSLHEGGRYSLAGEATFSLGRVHRSRLEQTETFTTIKKGGRPEPKTVVVTFSVELP